MIDKQEGRIAAQMPHSTKPGTKNLSNRKAALRVLMLTLVMIASGISLPLLYRFFTDSFAFRIQTISVTEGRRVQPREIQMYLRDFLGRPLYGVSLDDVRRKAQQHPWLKSVSARRLPPHGLMIDIRERQPMAFVALDQLYLVDDDGVLFLPARQDGNLHFPIVNGISKKAFEQNPKQSKKRIIKAVSALREHTAAKKPGGEISEIHVSDNFGVTVYFANGLEVILGTDNYQRKWLKLVQIFQLLREKKNDLAYAYLDDFPNTNQVAVRFKKV